MRIRAAHDTGVYVDCDETAEGKMEEENEVNLDDILNEEGEEDLGIISEEPKQEPAKEEPKEEPKVEPAPKAEPETPPEEPIEQKSHQVPLGELLDERKQRQASQTQVEQLNTQIQTLQTQIQTAQQAPNQQITQEQIDPMDDPEGFANSIVQRTQRENLNNKANLSEQFARERHGDEVVNAAYNAVVASGNGQSFINHQNPYGAIVDWHKNQQIAQETGGDLTAFKDKMRSELKDELKNEILSDLGVQKVSADPPPDLSNAPSASGNVEPLQSDDQVFRDIMNE